MIVELYFKIEVVHHIPPPPLEVSKRFFSGYLDSLIGIAQNSICDPVKGTGIILMVQSLDLLLRRLDLSPNDMDGCVKLNTD